MDHFVSVHRIRSCIRDESLVVFGPLLICRVRFEWLDAMDLSLSCAQLLAIELIDPLCMGDAASCQAGR